MTKTEAIREGLLQCLLCEDAFLNFEGFVANPEREMVDGEEQEGISRTQTENGLVLHFRDHDLTLTWQITKR